MGKNCQKFKFFEGKEINRVDSPFNEDLKDIFFPQEGPNFRRGTAGKIREVGQ